MIDDKTPELQTNSVLSTILINVGSCTFIKRSTTIMNIKQRVLLS